MCDMVRRNHELSWDIKLFLLIFIQQVILKFFSSKENSKFELGAIFSDNIIASSFWSILSMYFPT